MLRDRSTNLAEATLRRLPTQQRNEQNGGEGGGDQRDLLQACPRSECDRAEQEQVVRQARPTEGAEHRPNRNEEERVGKALAHREAAVQHQRRDQRQRCNPDRATSREHAAGDCVQREHRERNEHRILDLGPLVRRVERGCECIDRGEDDRVERRVGEATLAEDREVPRSREGLRHPLVAELVQENLGAVDPTDEHGAEHSRRDRESDERDERRGPRMYSRIGLNSFPAPPRLARAVVGEIARVDLAQNRAGLPVHARSVARPAEGVLPRTRGPGWPHGLGRLRSSTQRV
jgi:hypothetical protein